MGVASFYRIVRCSQSEKYQDIGARCQDDFSVQARTVFRLANHFQQGKTRVGLHQAIQKRSLCLGRSCTYSLIERVLSRHPICFADLESTLFPTKVSQFAFRCLRVLFTRRVRVEYYRRWNCIQSQTHPQTSFCLFCWELTSQHFLLSQHHTLTLVWKWMLSEH